MGIRVPCGQRVPLFNTRNVINPFYNITESLTYWWMPWQRVFLVKADVYVVTKKSVNSLKTKIIIKKMAICKQRNYYHIIPSVILKFLFIYILNHMLLLYLLTRIPCFRQEGKQKESHPTVGEEVPARIALGWGNLHQVSHPRSLVYHHSYYRQKMKYSLVFFICQISLIEIPQYHALCKTFKYDPFTSYMDMK